MKLVKRALHDLGAVEADTAATRVGNSSPGLPSACRDADGSTTYERASGNAWHCHCVGLYDLCTEARILDLVQDLLGEDLVLWGTHSF